MLAVPYALFPVLTAFWSHAAIFLPTPTSVLRAVLLMSAAAIGVTLAVSRLAQTLRRAGSVTAIGFCLLGLFPIVRSTLTGWMPNSNELFGVTYLACCATATWALARREAPKSQLYQVVRDVGMILAAIMALTAAFYAATWALRDKSGATLESLVAQPGPSASYPDVYHIIVDGFGRADVVANRYRTDLAPFIEGLRASGFEVSADRGSANYVQTALSVASVLSAAYIDPSDSTARDSRAPLHDRIQRSPVIGAFKRAGYQFIFIGSGYSLTREHRLADVCDCDYPALGEFETTILQGTVLNDLWPRWGYASHRQKILNAFTTLEAFAPGDRPRIVIAHILSPHPPFVFDASGAYLTPDRVISFHDGTSYKGTRDEYYRGYAAQVQYVARRLLQVSQRIEANYRKTGRGAVLIIHGDHGPRAQWDVIDAAKTDPSESLPVLLAIRWADGGRQEPAPASLVNIYRAFFRRYFDAELALLSDRGFVSSYSKPYQFIEVDINALRAGPTSEP